LTSTEIRRRQHKDAQMLKLLGKSITTSLKELSMLSKGKKVSYLTFMDR
jgi:hypothetical protein